MSDILRSLKHLVGAADRVRQTQGTQDFHPSLRELYRAADMARGFAALDHDPEPTEPVARVATHPDLVEEPQPCQHKRLPLDRLEEALRKETRRQADALGLTEAEIRAAGL